MSDLCVANILVCAYLAVRYHRDHLISLRRALLDLSLDLGREVFPLPVVALPLQRSSCTRTGIYAAASRCDIRRVCREHANGDIEPLLVHRLIHLKDCRLEFAFGVHFIGQQPEKLCELLIIPSQSVGARAGATAAAGTHAFDR